MLLRGRYGGLLASGIVLALAGLLCAAVLVYDFQHHTFTPPTYGWNCSLFSSRLTRCFLGRVSATWAYTAVDAAQKYGEDGVNVLETFGDDAAYCPRTIPKPFAALVRVWEIGHGPLSLSWKLEPCGADWAQNGKLDAFLRKIDQLPPIV